MVIGIPLRYDVVEKNNTFFINNKLIDLFESLNCKVKVLIPNQKVKSSEILEDESSNFYHLTNDNKLEIEKLVDEVDGIFLPGGRIICDFERYLIKVCKEKNIPVLGVCLGFQIMANYDTPKVILNPVDNHYQELSDDELFHKIMIDKKSKLYEIIQKEEIMVNSFHKQTVPKTDSFDISAVDENGVIEALELKDADFIIGVQWHPEISYKFDENSRLIIHAFIDKCSNNHRDYVPDNIKFHSYKTKLDDFIKLYITDEERQDLLKRDEKN